MELAARKGVHPCNVVCSHKPSLSRSVEGNTRVSVPSWHGPHQFLHNSLTIRHSILNGRPSVTGRHSNLRVQAAAKQTFSSFDEMLEKSEQPVLVDFYATWCGPCQYMVPILEDVGRRMKDKIRVVKIDTEKYPSLASRYDVQALPTFILFKNGQPFDRLVGFNDTSC
ncbi:thioredoxin Y, chloroplastic isoform X2 [Cryptomeria japonica]|uniref:thioredoxin Y, chloroplastic isoform X2 n=1 Tax=Cryptomeria japonica TaxID=3369 RepID=UPI0027DA9135|nr:thioredoxin Y, chloroplastic isoform X2 [Cryptomeria japonica]